MKKIVVEYTVPDDWTVERVTQSLVANEPHHLTWRCIHNGPTNCSAPPRASVIQFGELMEAKLSKNDHKTTWRDKPIEALFRLLLLEIEEFKVAYEFFSVADAQAELVDVANFALIVHDRLSLLGQGVNPKKAATEETT